MVVDCDFVAGWYDGDEISCYVGYEVRKSDCEIRNLIRN